MTKDEAPEGTHDKTCGKDAECCNQRGDRVLRREKMASNYRGEIAVCGKVVPFHHIAGDPGEDRAFLSCRIVAIHSSPPNGMAGVPLPTQLTLRRLWEEPRRRCPPRHATTAWADERQKRTLSRYRGIVVRYGWFAADPFGSGRGRYKRDYAPGTLREKLYGQGRARIGADHP